MRTRGIQVFHGESINDLTGINPSMSHSGTYGVDRDIKEISGSSSRHSARIYGQYPGIFPSIEVPTIEHARKRRSGKPSSTEVGDLSIIIDLDANDLDDDDNFIQAVLSVVGLHPKDADFDVLSVTERVLRALSKAKFRNLAELKFNDRRVYEHPELEFDLRNTLDVIGELAIKEQRIDSAEARIIEGPDMDAEAFVKVSRSHSRFTHDIRIDIRGNIEGENLRRIVNYLEENLKIEKLFERDIFPFG